MKKISIYILAAFSAAALLTSCDKSATAGQEDSFGGGKTLSASFDAISSPLEGTKTSLAGVDVLWKATDKIIGFNAAGTAFASSAATLADASGAKAAFTFAGASTSEVFVAAAYPSDAVTVDNIASRSFKAVFPVMRPAVAGGFADGANVSFSDGTGETLIFKNAGAIVGVEVKNDGIVGISLSANEVLAGEATVSMTGAAPVAVASNTQAKKVTLQGNFVKNNTYYFVVIPGTYTGIKLEFTNNAGQTAVYTNPNPLTVSRNGNVTVFAKEIPAAKWGIWHVERVLGAFSSTTSATVPGTGTAARLCLGQDLTLGKDGSYWITTRQATTGGHGVYRMSPDYKLTKLVTSAEEPLLSGSFPWEGSVDSQGLYYFCSKFKGKLFTCTADGTIAEYPVRSGGTALQLPHAMRVLVDDADNLYLLFRGDGAGLGKILKIKDNNVLAEWPIKSGQCEHIAFNQDKTRIFAMGTATYDIKLLDLATGTFTRIAGKGVKPTAATYTDGTPGNPLTATIDMSEGALCAPDGTLYFTDCNSKTLRRFTPGENGDYSKGTITTIAGTKFNSTAADGTGLAARFSYPNMITFAPDGNTLYMLDGIANTTLRKIYYEQK